MLNWPLPHKTPNAEHAFLKFEKKTAFPYLNTLIAFQSRKKKINVRHLIYDEHIEYKYIISWPTLFFFEVACSLIVLDCTLRKIQPNIQGGGAKLQRTVPVYQCRYQILHSADIRYCTAQFR